MYSTKNNICKLSRHAKEIGIQIHEMEKYKWCYSEKLGRDIGKQAYFMWIEKYSKKVRAWLESLSDEEIDERYKALPEKIKRYIEEKIR